VFLDWSHDERPTWVVSIHYRRPDWDNTDLPPQASERIASELRKTGMTRHVRVSLDADLAGCGLTFHIHAKNRAEAEAVAERIARTCMDRAGMPFCRSISARSAKRWESVEISA
jgi:hypothetical protein